MRFKPVPEPPAELEQLRTYQRSLPLVPGTVDDCCDRLRRRQELPDRETARDWLVFLAAIGLAEKTPSGYRRTAADPTRDRVREGLLEHVLLAREALAVVEDSGADPVDVETVFDAIADETPRHVRLRDPGGWEDEWRDRTARLLGWFELAEAVERHRDNVFVRRR